MIPGRTPIKHPAPSRFTIKTGKFEGGLVSGRPFINVRKKERDDKHKNDQQARIPVESGRNIEKDNVI